MRDPRFTMTSDLFEACLAFFRDHYEVVDLETVAAAASGGGDYQPAHFSSRSTTGGQTRKKSRCRCLRE